MGREWYLQILISSTTTVFFDPIFFTTALYFAYYYEKCTGSLSQSSWCLVGLLLFVHGHKDASTG